MRFEKWQATGNDFVLVEAAEVGQLDGASSLVSDRVHHLCDRHFGVGADGVLILDQVGRDRPSMAILNADGSRAEMCGNGLRCAAAWLVEHRGMDEGQLTVQTDVGPLACDVRRRGPDHYWVSVAAGTATVGPAEQRDGPWGSLRIDPVDVGNPHAVCFEAEEHLLDRVGPAWDRAADGGCNVELCRVAEEGRRLEVVVYERGVGRTLACGTGACAVAAAAVARGRSRGDGPITVVMPGGALEVTLHAGDAPSSFVARLAGPAVRVFRGDLPR